MAPFFYEIENSEMHGSCLPGASLWVVEEEVNPKGRCGRVCLLWTRGPAPLSGCPGPRHL